MEKKNNSSFSGILSLKKHLDSILHLLCWACVVQLPSWQNPEAKPGGTCYDPHNKTGRALACQMHVVTQTGCSCPLGLCRTILEPNIFSRKVASPWRATIPHRFSQVPDLNILFIVNISLNPNISLGKLPNVSLP